jgi:hypothetical protein
MICSGGNVDLCSNATCNPASGACEVVPRVCDDGIECTRDSCNVSVGCVFTPDDARCDEQDPCQTYSCSATLGCVNVNVSCPLENGTFCTTASCIAFEGCSNQSLLCNATSGGATDCNTVACVEAASSCVVTEKKCAVPPGIIAVAAVSAGVIAGIVIGIIAFLACAGGASYAAFQRSNNASMDAVTNNPLYKSEGRQGNNPLFKQKEEGGASDSS